MEITMEFARRDDCLNNMVPSDLRVLVGDKIRLQDQVVVLEQELKETALLVAQEHAQRMALIDLKSTDEWSRAVTVGGLLARIGALKKWNDEYKQDLKEVGCLACAWRIGQNHCRLKYSQFANSEWSI